MVSLGSIHKQKKMSTEKKPWRDKIKEYRPEKEYADDDSYGEAASEMIDELSEYKNQNSEANRKLVEMLEAEPAVADFLADIIKGASIPVALSRNFDMESLTPQEGEPDYEEWDKSKQERISNHETRRKSEQELTANKVESSKAFEAFKAKRNWTDEQLDEFVDKIDAILGDIYKGKVTVEFLESIEVAMNHDSELEATKQAALIEGKNMAIEPKKNIKPKGDGLPKLGSVGDMPEEDKKTPDIFDRAAKRSKERARF